MSESVEVVVCNAPFTVRRTVRWTDCDPAGVAFTGRFTEYLIDAVMHFYRHIGWGPGVARDDGGVGLPCKHMALTFHVSLEPNAVVDIRIQVAAIRDRTFDLRALAYLPDGRLAFEGVFTPICIISASHASAPIPQALHEVLRRHTQEVHL